jgi:chromosomal replication initiation ATPase DnaA
MAAQAIEESLGISLEDMRSNSRITPLVIARSVFGYVCYEYPALIVSSYINRSHNTVIKSRDTMATCIKSKIDDGYGAYRNAYNSVINKLNNVEKVDWQETQQMG